MKFLSTVLESVQVSPKVKLVRLVWDGVEKFPFRPGQWVGVWSDDYLGENGRPVRRAFSIASKQGEKYLELCVARGKGFSAFLQDLKEGSKIWVDGPYGNFWLRPAKECLFVAGGTGIAPFRPMVHEALKQGAKVALLYSAKTPADFVYLDEFKSLKGLKLVATITADHEYPVWDGKQGRVQKHLPSLLGKDCAVYVCGPPLMVEDVEALLLKSGHPKELLFIDKWE